MARIVLIAVWVLSVIVYSQDNRIIHDGQSLFLSGCNVAWRFFSADVGVGKTDFDYFEKLFEDVSKSGGNSVRWWLHTNGTNNPEFDSSGMVTGLEKSHLHDMKRIFDAALRNGILVDICLWSFDMLRKSHGKIATDRAKKLLMDEKYTWAYINNALLPMVREFKDHPAVLCWEIFNEPEGMSDELGWDLAYHVPMKVIQKFINLTAGAIHRAAPGVKVSNGSWCLMAQTDIDPADKYKNYYSDEQLITAGGDSMGILDFYQVHYYAWARTPWSPFHHPVTYWKLDKPVIIAEFYARETFGIPCPHLFQKAYDGGYAGAWAWSYNPEWNRIKPCIEYMKDKNLPDIEWKYSGNYPPYVISAIADTVLHINLKDPVQYVDLSRVFFDIEDKNSLVFSILDNSNPEFINACIDGSHLYLTIPASEGGFTDIVCKAQDSAKDYTTEEFRVAVKKPGDKNLAFYQPVTVSSVEKNSNYLAYQAVDGDPHTRWSSAHSKKEWIYVDLGKLYKINRILLLWELAYAKRYDIQISKDLINWTTIYTENDGDGNVDDIRVKTETARYVRICGKEKATRWGYSLYEFQVYYCDHHPESEKE